MYFQVKYIMIDFLIIHTFKEIVSMKVEILINHLYLQSLYKCSDKIWTFIVTHFNN
jgi:hypothetical protein